MNCIRRHLSGIKGGRLAAACHPARVLTLASSDVPGDEPTTIGSGPTVADPTTCADALAIARRYALDLPPAVLDCLARGRGAAGPDLSSMGCWQGVIRWMAPDGEMISLVFTTAWLGAW